MKAKVIIIHGAYGHPEENWFPWLKTQMMHSGIECYVPSFPTPEGQHLHSWIKIFNEIYSAHGDAHTILIGHSLGAVFLLNWLERHVCRPSAVILAGAFLGKTGIAKFDDINVDFFQQPFQWDVIKSRSDRFICYHGDDDPYVSRSSFEFIADKLQALKVVISQGGHLNAAAGYIEFPQLWQQVKVLLKLI